MEYWHFLSWSVVAVSGVAVAVATVEVERARKSPTQRIAKHSHSQAFCSSLFSFCCEYFYKVMTHEHNYGLTKMLHV